MLALELVMDVALDDREVKQDRECEDDKAAPGFRFERQGAADEDAVRSS